MVMNIQNHIKNLLYRHDCVIVAGLGGFVCRIEPARIENDVVFPPSKKISFNESLKSGDGLLENYIAKHEKISYQIARQNILEFSEKIKDTLINEHEVALNGLGIFRNNDHHNLVFEPETQQEWHIEAYGLPEFKLNPIAVEEQSEMKVAFKSDKGEEKNATATQRSAPNVLKYAAIGIIAIGVAGIIGSQVYKNRIDAYNTAEMQKVNSLVEQKIQQSSFVLSEPLQPISVQVKTPKETLGKYHIVGGAFRIKANVDKKIKQLREIGYNAMYIGENKYGLHQVAYGSYSDKKEALKALRQIKSKENPSAWLFVKEL